MGPKGKIAISVVVFLLAVSAAASCRRSRSSGFSGPPPSFEAWDVWASGTYAPGDLISVDRTIDNTGGRSGSCDYSLYLSTNDIISGADYEIYSGATASIPSGGSNTLTVIGSIPLSIPTGPYYVGLYIWDTYSGTPYWVATSVATVNIGGGGGPIFEAFDVFASGNYAPGDPILVDRTIDNTGGSAGTCDYSLYLSTNSVISTSDYLIYSGTTASIPSGGSSVLTVTGTVPVGIPTGDYYAGLYITDINGGTPQWVATLSPLVTIGGCADDFYEQNDSSGTAFDLTLDEGIWLSTIFGDGVANDDDFYAIDVTPGFLNVIVDVRFIHAWGDIDVELYDSLGFLVDFSDTSSDNEYIDVIVPSSGIYYIVVYPFLSSCNTYDLWWDDL